ncbi:GTPase RsgA [Phaeobacter sp. HF9A]|uniref:GTPase RsgA n=1 Tax=Phaeobacter sp. HF9A TaxID=2721561 RepID=UPI0034C696B6
MTRDYSGFLPSAASGPTPRQGPSPLEKLGWKPFFSQQITINDLDRKSPARVTEVHRSGLRLLGDGLDTTLPPGLDATVGDWILYDPDSPAQSTLLQRSSLFARRAPGHDRQRQLIAANVDTVFIVSSCNHDFNVARLERYIALALEAEATPVILLTKADICEDPASYVDAARAISDRVLVEALNAKSDEPRAKLASWCKLGQTVAFLGSSGVGKTTLVNAFFPKNVAETAAIREDDSKGRHDPTPSAFHR